MAEPDFLSSMRAMVKDQMIDLNTAIQGEIVEYADGLATVQPIGKKLFKDGTELSYPLLYNVHVQFPSFNGGQCGMKGPIVKGDKVILIFLQQGDDGTDDRRRHDLSDAYAIMAGNSQLAGGTNNDDTIIFFGAASVRITKGGEVIINAPGGLKVQGNSELNGTLQINGNVSNTGTLYNNNKDVGSTSTHNGVQPGIGITGMPT